MTRRKVWWIAVAVVVVAVALGCVVEAAQLRRKQGRLLRLTKTRGLEVFKTDRLAGTLFEDRYQGLGTAALLREQMAYQLYRNDIVRRQKRASQHLDVRQTTDGNLVYEHTGSGNGIRRYAFRTPYFPQLKAVAPAALKDLRVVLTRLRFDSASERIELLRLVFMLSKASGNIADGRSILLADALPAPSTELIPEAQKHVRMFAMNFYNLLETDPQQRQENNRRFVAAVGPAAERAQMLGKAVRLAKVERRKRLPPGFHPQFQDISHDKRPLLVPAKVSQ